MLVCFILIIGHTDIFSFYRISSLYRAIFYVGLQDCVRHNEDFVLLRFVVSRFSHTIYCNFDRAEEYRSLYRGFGYKEGC